MGASNSSDLSVTVAVVIALAAPAFVLFHAFMNTSAPQAPAMAMANDTLAERIRPVMTLDEISGPKTGQQMGSTAVAEAKSPEALYQGACLACHAAGVGNAPKLGDKAAWAPKAAMGIDSLLQTVITGKGIMPPKGGSSYSDDELRSVIEYMLAEAGL